MNKQEFLAQLRKGLTKLSRQEAEERVTFYSEMIDDRMEEGLSEEEAVAAVGTIEEIVALAVADIPQKNTATKSKKRVSAWVIVLLILGSPIWLSLGIAAFAVILSLYISLWAIIIALWAVFASLIACAVGGILAGIIFIYFGNTVSGIAMVGAGIVSAGLSIFMYYGCKATTKGILIVTKKLAVLIKNCFVKKEEA